MHNQNENNSFFNSVSWDEFAMVIGSELLMSEVLPFLQKTVEVLNRKDAMMLVAENNSKEFYIYTESVISKELEIVAFVSKNSLGNYYCQPLLLLNTFCYRVSIDFEDELDEYDIKPPFNKRFIYDILYELNSLDDHEKLPDYLYYISVLLIYEYNLDYISSDIIDFSSDSINFEGYKTEILKKKNDIFTEEVAYMIELNLNSDSIQIIKRFENGKKETYSLKILDFILEFE